MYAGIQARARSKSSPSPLPTRVSSTGRPWGCLAAPAPPTKKKPLAVLFPSPHKEAAAEALQSCRLSRE